MATAYIDRIDTLSMMEDMGVVNRLTRTARVVGLTDTSPEILVSALEAAGIPAALSELATDPNLVLKERRPRLLGKGVCDVELEYVSRAELGLNVFRITGSINQIQLIQDSYGNNLFVQHTYPDSPYELDPNYQNLTFYQGSSVPVNEPFLEMEYRKIVETADIKQHVGTWLNKLNGTAWAGDAAYRWLITRVDSDMFKYVPAGLNQYLVRYQFQLNPNGWQPRQTFIDDRTNQPPYGLVLGEGLKFTNWYWVEEFNVEFPF